MSEKLYIKCVACNGHGVETYDIETRTLPSGICPVCDGEGYIYAGIHTGQVDMLKRVYDQLKPDERYTLLDPEELP